MPRAEYAVPEWTRRFIERAEWTFAKTMPENPHEYAVRQRCRAEGLEADFDRFVLLIREHGCRERWGKNWYRYLAVDGWRYWTMTGVPRLTRIINRARLTALVQPTQTLD